LSGYIGSTTGKRGWPYLSHADARMGANANLWLNGSTLRVIRHL